MMNVVVQVVVDGYYCSEQGHSCLRADTYRYHGNIHTYMYMYMYTCRYAPAIGYKHIPCIW